jgi:hypothetical protein
LQGARAEIAERKRLLIRRPQPTGAFGNAGAIQPNKGWTQPRIIGSLFAVLFLEGTTSPSWGRFAYDTDGPSFAVRPFLRLRATESRYHSSTPRSGNSPPGSSWADLAN